MKFEANSGSQCAQGAEYCINCERNTEYHEPSTHACATSNDEAVVFAHTNERLRQAEAATAAPALLAKAAGIMTERAKEYDQPGGERSVGKIVTAFNAITGQQLTEAQGWLFLQILKQVRLFAAPGFHADSAEDNIAYAALLAEAKQRDAQPH